MSLLGKPSFVWRQVFGQYEAVLKAKADNIKDAKKRKELISLDTWYQQELRQLISGRSEKFITHEELAKLMKWKLMRGKFRPRLQQMVEENSAESVETASKKGFQALPSIKAAVEALTVLRAVGPATASAVLAAGAPQHAPFMADESMLALPGLQPLKYTLPAYQQYVQLVADITKILKKEDGEFGWTPHHVELALWTLQMAKTLKLDNVLAMLDHKTPSTTESADHDKTRSASNGQDTTASSKNKRKTTSSDKPVKKKKT
ncbi:uncharacterized protein [Littorina saxatilis]|uniref:Uncharacterized protein n=1 Tax=Littorina saxatilis TaxID=31220 RepID=A0AAN9BV50_9CAEN